MVRAIIAYIYCMPCSTKTSVVRERGGAGCQRTRMGEVELTIVDRRELFDMHIAQGSEWDHPVQYVIKYRLLSLNSVIKVCRNLFSMILNSHCGRCIVKDIA